MLTNAKGSLGVAYILFEDDSTPRHWLAYAGTYNIILNMLENVWFIKKNAMQTLGTLEECQIYATHRLSTLIIRDIFCHEGVPYSLELAAWVLFYRNSTQTVSSSIANKSIAQCGRFGV